MTKSNFNARCTDVAREPTATLAPIEGYEKTPLVSSLKEAAALIETEKPIHNLEKMIWAAERNAENPLDGLTSAESASIYLYTMEWPEPHMGFCTLLNQTLRSEKRKDLKSRVRVKVRVNNCALLVEAPVNSPFDGVRRVLS